MPTDYLLTSLEVPELQVPSDYLNIQDATPNVHEAVGAGDISVWMAKVSRNAERNDKAARLGGGAYALYPGGLDVTVAGLTALITKGEWVIDGPLPDDLEVLFPDDDPFELALADDALNYLWATRGGQLTKNTDSLLPPVGDPAVYAGRLEMDTGALVGNYDRSGVPVLLGNQVWVRTADAGEPAWAAPAGIGYWHITNGGLYLWDGSDYHHIARSPIPTADLADAVANLIGGAPAISAGAEAANARQVTIQLKNAKAANLAARRLVRVWLADAQWGGEAAAAPDGGVALDTGVNLNTISTRQWVFLPDAAGIVRITVVESTVKTFWVHASDGRDTAAFQLAFA